MGKQGWESKHWATFTAHGATTNMKGLLFHNEFDFGMVQG